MSDTGNLGNYWPSEVTNLKKELTHTTLLYQYISKLSSKYLFLSPQRSTASQLSPEKLLFAAENNTETHSYQIAENN